MQGMGLGPWGILIVMQIILIFLGMFLDWVGILLLCVPIFVPVIKSLGAQASASRAPTISSCGSASSTWSTCR